jgi:amidase
MRLGQQQFQVEGPIARHVDDLRLALSVLRGPDRRDPEAVPTTQKSGRGRPRVGVVLDVAEHPFATRSTPEVAAAQQQAAERLGGEGYEVVEVQAPQLGEAASLWWRLAMPDFDASGFGAQIEQFADRGMKTSWLTMLDLCRELLGEAGLVEFANGYARRSLLRRQISTLMEDHPVLLLPASGEEPFPLDDDISSRSRMLELMRRQWVNLAVPVLGLPAVGMGTLARPGRAPLGVQLMGRAFEEEIVLDVAEALQRASPLALPVDPVAPARR